MTKMMTQIVPNYIYVFVGKNTNLDMDYMFIAKNRVQDRRQKNNPKSGKNVVLNEWNG